MGILQAVFLAIALFGLDGPFVSTHFVRQCFTFDVAHHVFHDGWSSVFTPKGSFTQLSGPDPDDMTSPLNIPAPRFTICHLEFPFIGIFGWPAAQVFPHHERAVVRLVGVAFGILSIRFMFLVLRCWLETGPALLGTALWSFAPLVLQFGQVGMPDILATTGLAAAFYASLRGNLAASSGAFLFTLLAKLSVIPFGLVILVALAVARPVGSVPAFIRLALAWGIAPLLGVVYLVASGFEPAPPGSWVIVGGYQPGVFGPVKLHDFTRPENFLRVALNLFPFGCGLLGLLGLIFAALESTRHLDRLLKISIVVALVSYYLMERIVWLEPQYSVPVVFFLVLAASFGFPALIRRWRESRHWVALAVAVLVLHAAMAAGCTWFLKAARVPNIAAIAAAGNLTPSDARIVAYCRTTDQVPPVWLGRNSFTFTPYLNPGPATLDYLETRLSEFHRAGFDYLVLFDTPRHVALTSRSSSATQGDVTDPSSPLRQFLDERYPVLYNQDHVVLYSLAGQP